MALGEGNTEPRMSAYAMRQAKLALIGGSDGRKGVELLSDLGQEKVRAKKKRKRSNSTVKDVGLLPSEEWQIIQVADDSDSLSNGQLVAQKPKKKKKAVEKISSKAVPGASSFTQLCSLSTIDDSEKDARDLLASIIHPLDVDVFMRKHWEQSYYSAKHGQGYFGDLFSVAEFERLLQNDYVEFGTNINLAKYVDGQRQTHNPVGRAHASLVWQFYQEGCSVQFINPQSYSDKVWRLCDRLQEFFCTFVGANSYLTPPGTQGFAPHWDDVDVFVMQLEGRKKWRVYLPSGADTQLPRESSGNFSQAEVDANNKLVFEGWVEPGDVLFMPRGFVHQGFADAHAHSFHLTVSVGHRSTYADMLEKLVPQVLAASIEGQVGMRKSLPPQYLSHTGLGCSLPNPKHKAAYQQHLAQLMQHVSESVGSMADAGADMMGAKFIKQALPPCLSSEESALTALGQGTFWSTEAGKPVPNDGFELSLSHQVKFIRKHSQRLVFATEESGSLEHRMFNSRVFEGRPNSSIPFEAEELDAVQCLLDAYPEYIVVADLPLDDDEDKLSFAYKLWHHCLLFAKPL